MNITNQKNNQQHDVSRKAASQITRLAAWSVIAGTVLCGTGYGADETQDDPTLPEPVTTTVELPAVPTPDPVTEEPAPPADAEPVVTIDPAPVAPTPATTDQKSPEPKTEAPKADDLKVVEPKSPEPKVVEPTSPEPKVVAPQPVEPVAPATGTTKVTVPVPATPTSTPTSANDPSLVAKGLSAAGNINLMVNKSQVLSTRVPYKRVSIGQPEVADVNLVGPSEVLLTAKKPGSTQLIIWDDQDHSQVIDVVVGFDLRGLETQISQMFPKGKITVESANGTIVLRGHVPDLQTAQKAAQVAAPYNSGDKASVLNFLEVSGGQQVVLQVRFAEVTRSIQQQLGFNAFVTDGKFAFGVQNGPGGTPIGALAQGQQSTIPNVPFFGSAKFGNASFEYFVNALRTDGLLRILAEPNLTATSGQQASFLAGGEIPILVPQASGGGSVTTIEYKQYGILLNFTPTVLGDGRVRLQCSPQVSDLDYAHAVVVGGAPVPALLTRNVNTTVELAEGQTFSLAGLLRNEVTASKNVTPILGDIPVLGALFRSVSYQRSETELIVLVTPRLIEAMNPNEVPTVPGERWRDPTEAQLFLGTDLGGPAPDTRHAPVRSSRFYGTSGFVPAAVQQK